MTTQAHRYDHPAYLARQILMLGVGAAATGGTNAQFSFPHAVKLHRVTAIVRTAGTAAHDYTVRNGVTSLGALTVDTSAADSVVTSGDLAATLAAGDVLNILKGADTVGIAAFTAEVSVPVGTALTV